MAGENEKESKADEEGNGIERRLLLFEKLEKGKESRGFGSKTWWTGSPAYKCSNSSFLTSTWKHVFFRYVFKRHHLVVNLRVKLGNSNQ